MRPFISGHVANSMAAEVIALLHSLLMAPESNAAQIWTTTAEKVGSVSLPCGSKRRRKMASPAGNARKGRSGRDVPNWPDVPVNCFALGICKDRVVLSEKE